MELQVKFTTAATAAADAINGPEKALIDDQMTI